MTVLSAAALQLMNLFTWRAVQHGASITSYEHTISWKRTIFIIKAVYVFRVCAVFLYPVSGCAAPDVSSCSVSALRHLIRKVIQVCDQHWLHASRRLVVSCECFSLLKFEVSVNVSVDSRKSSVCSDGFHQNNLQKLNFKSWKRRQKSTAARCFECKVSRNWLYVCFYVFISSTL